jgi:nitroreductase
MLEMSQTKITVEEAIQGRRSIRAFLPKAVDKNDIVKLLELAARAPSGTNTQPWKVYVLSGKSLHTLSEKILVAHNDPEVDTKYIRQYQYYPEQWQSPYIERRRKVGWDLYALLGLTRDNKAGMHAQHGRNYQFFDAPVGLIFTIDKVMNQGSWLDYGMFLQNIMLAARGFGLDTCPQAAFIQFHTIISAHLAMSDQEMVVCGMSLGYADMSKIENSLVTERDSVEKFTQFLE